MRRINWWIYTIVIGALPVIVRFFLYLTVEKLDLDYVFNESDLIAFGLVLCISNLKELESQSGISATFREITKGSQILLIILMSGFLWVNYYTEIDRESDFEAKNIRYCTRFLSFMCFVSSVVIYYHPNFRNDET